MLTEKAKFHINNNNLDYLIRIVSCTMDKVVKGTQDLDIIEPIQPTQELIGITNNVIETIVVKELRELALGK